MQQASCLLVFGNPCLTPSPTTTYVSQTIFQHSRECDTVLVQKSIMAMMRLCQRLLPYKAADISEPLMRGIQLLSLVDEQVRGAVAPLLHGTGAKNVQGTQWKHGCKLPEVKPCVKFM